MQYINNAHIQLLPFIGGTNPNRKQKHMNKRNFLSIIIIIASILSILNIDFSNISESKPFWSLILSSIVIIATLISIFNNKKENNKKLNWVKQN
jgi:low temperature requirement protein LtrA